MYQRLIRLLLFVLIIMPLGLSASPGQAQSNESWLFRVIESDAQHLLVELTVPTFEIETITQDGIAYQRLRLDEWRSWGQLGQPELPIYSELVGMPWPGKPQISVVEAETEILPSYRVYPTPDAYVGQALLGPDLIEVFTLDEIIYNTNTTYPGPLAEAIEPGMMRDQPLFRLNLQPFQYNPVTQELSVTRRMLVQVTFPTARTPTQPTAAAFRNILAQTVVNYAALPQSVPPSPEDEANRSRANGAKYVIIAHPNFVSAIQPLANYRSSQGLSTLIATTTDIYTSHGGGQKGPEAIQNYLEDAYNNWSTKPEYVLLVGDADADALVTETNGNNEIGIIAYNDVSTDYVPAHYEDTLGYNLLTPIDAWYTKLNGDDPYFDLIIGRIPARDAGEVTTVVNKIINYEQSPTPGNWARRAVLVADDGYISPDEGIIFRQDMNTLDDALPSGVAATKMYEYESSTNVAGQIDNGVLLLAYSGHGNKNQWGVWPGTGRIYEKNRIGSMSNGNKLPFMMVVNCSNGYFADANTSRVLAEEFLLISNKGGIAAFAPAANSFPTPNTMISQALTEAIFDEGDYILGSATTTARIKALNQNTLNIPKNLFEMFTYFGDPALRLNVPATLTLAAQANKDTVKTGETITYNINYSVSDATSNDLTLVNTLPEHVTFQSASATPTTVDGRVITWGLGDLPAGTNGSLSLTATVSTEGLSDGQTISNQVRLSDIHGGDKLVNIEAEVVLIEQPPVADFFVEGGASNVRVDELVTFNNQSTGTNLAFTWDFGDGSEMNTDSNDSVTHTFSTPGDYSVTLTATNSAGSDSKTVVVTVKSVEEPVEPPVASFNSSSPDQLGETTSFLNTSDDGGENSANITYTWDFGDSHNSSEVHPLHTYEAEGEYVVSLTVVNIRLSLDNTYTATVVIEAPNDGGDGDGGDGDDGDGGDGDGGDTEFSEKIYLPFIVKGS